MAETKDDDQDPRFPGGMNYLDWVMNVLPADEHSPKTLAAIVKYERQARASYESGVKPKKADTGPKIDLVSLGLIKAKPKIIRRLPSG